MRELGFYWIKVGDRTCVAEWTVTFEVGWWNLPGTDVTAVDDMVTVLSDRIPEPIREKNTPKEHYCCERSSFLGRDKYGNWHHAGLIIDICPFCALNLSEPKFMGLAVDPTTDSH